MWRHFWAGAVFVILSAIVFLVESSQHFLPRISEYFGISLGFEQTPEVALLLVAGLFVIVGIIASIEQSIIAAPFIFGAAHVTLAGPQFLGERLGVYQIPFTLVAASLFGAFILMDAESMWRLRRGRFWKRLWVGLSVAAVNYALYVVLSKGGTRDAFFVAVPLAAAGFGYLCYLSDFAGSVEDFAKKNAEEAERVPELVQRAQSFEKGYEERGTALESHKERILVLESTVARLQGENTAFRDMLPAKEDSTIVTVPSPSLVMRGLREPAEHDSRLADHVQAA